MRVNCREAKYDIYCGRPRKGEPWRYGNAFVIGPDGDRATVIDKFKNWLTSGQTYGNIDATPERREWILQNLAALQGKILGCFCSANQACHCDILISLSNDNLQSN